MAKNSPGSLLTSVDSLFTTQQERDKVQRNVVVELPIAEISDFPNHPYHITMDSSMTEMAESIRERGLLEPALVRPMRSGGYQMVAGHRRKVASELAGKDMIPCIIKEMTDEEATIVMVDSNQQREHILPSERAFAYKMRLDAMKRQAGRPNKGNSATVLQNFGGKTSRELLAEKSGESHEQVRKYIRLTNLLPEILEMVDNALLKASGKQQIALRPAVELSYLTAAEQKDLLEIMQSEDCTPSHAQAIKMRNFSAKGKLNTAVILSIMQEEKPNQVEQFKMPKERIAKFFAPGTPVRQMEDTIVKALELYRRRQREIER